MIGISRQVTDEKQAKDDSRILNSNVLLNGVMETIQLLAILILTAFVIVVILVGSGVIFGKGFAQIDFREDLNNNPVSQVSIVCKKLLIFIGCIIQYLV